MALLWLPRFLLSLGMVLTLVRLGAFTYFEFVALGGRLLAEKFGVLTCAVPCMALISKFADYTC